MSPLRLLSRTLLAATVSALAACGDSTGSPSGPAARVDILGGNAQTGPAGTELPQAVVVKVTDDKGHEVKGQVVSFVVTAGGGHVFAGTGITNADGVVQERWTLGAAGPQSLEARAVDSATGQALVFATFTATATLVVGPPTQAEAVGGDSSVVGVVGSVVEDTFGVFVRDAAGNPAPGAQVAWAVTSGGGSVTSPTTTDAAGVARTQWVLGATAVPQTATATVAGKTLTFTAYAADQLLVDAGNGQTAGAGTVVSVRVGAKSSVVGSVPGLPIHWTVTSGGGSVTPAVGRTTSDPNGRALGIASAQWTLGASGPQTLTATAGSLSVAFTATSLAAGSRALLAQVPGRVLDVTSDAVVWLDSAGGTRRVKLRTLPGGGDQVVKVDSSLAGGPVYAYRFDGGVLVWNASWKVFEWRAGTLTFLSQAFQYGSDANKVRVNGPWAAWISADSPDSLTGVRRNLPAGTSIQVPQAWALGPNGEIAAPVTGGVLLWKNGVATTLPVSGEGSGYPFRSIYTDGVGAAYLKGTFPTAYAGVTTPAGHVLLGGVNEFHNGALDLLYEGGWTGLHWRDSASPVDNVQRRSPTGERVLLVSAAGARLAALSPSGTVAYSSLGQYYLDVPGSGARAVGPALAGETVIWRENRFVLLSGGTAYALLP